MLTLGQAFITKPRLLMIDELSPRAGADHRRAAARHRARRSATGDDDHPRRAVGERRPHGRQHRLLHGEGRDPLPRPDQGAARAARRPPFGLPRGRGHDVDARGQDAGARPAAPWPTCSTEGTGRPRGREPRQALRRHHGHQRRRPSSSTRTRSSASSARTARARRRCSTRSRASSASTADGCTSAARTSPTSRPTGGPAAASAGRSRTPGMFPALTVRENIAIALERQLDVRDPVAAALNLPVVADAERKVDEKVDELIELMGLQAFTDKFVSELSTGQPADRRPRLHPRPRAERDPVRRAVLGHRPEGDRGAGSAPASESGARRGPACSSSSTTCRSSPGSATG